MEGLEVESRATTPAMPDPWEPESCNCCLGDCDCGDCESCLDSVVEVEGDWDSPFHV